MSKRVAPVTGTGCLFFGGAQLEVTYVFKVRGHKPGGRQFHGSVSGDSEAIREAYRAISIRLRLADGAEHALIIVAHSLGSPTAYFESAPKRSFTPSLAMRAPAGDSA